MSATRTAAATHTFTNTAVHLGSTIVACLTELLLHLGVHPGRLDSNLEFYEDSIAFWIEEKTLGSVIVEVYRGSVFQTSLEFPIAYSAYDGTARFADGLERIRRQKEKLDRLPSGCRFEVIVTSRPGFVRTRLDGWGPLGRALASTTSTYSFGTVARGPGASASLRIGN